jgi:hypothetical protein
MRRELETWQLVALPRLQLSLHRLEYHEKDYYYSLASSRRVLLNLDLARRQHTTILTSCIQ